MKNPFSLYVIAAMALIALSYNVLAKTCEEMNSDQIATQDDLSTFCRENSDVPRHYNTRSAQAKCLDTITESSNICISKVALSLCTEMILTEEGLSCFKEKRNTYFQANAEQLCSELMTPYNKSLCLKIIANISIETDLIEECHARSPRTDSVVLGCLDPKNWYNR